MLFNLAGNAIKFTERGGVSIIVEPGEQAEAIAISVRDTGIGISPDDQARIFLEFEQADGSSTRKFGGTGLGLAISKRIVESMGGSIAVDSAPGEGAEFRMILTLPRAGDAEEPALAVPDLAGNDVLIVAPAALEASMMARRLQRWGARTKIVPDEQVAAALLPEQLWSVLLVDHALGTTACAALARIAAAIPRRIVLVTPATRSELAALGEAGFTGYLIKPVRAASLAARFADDQVFDPAGAIGPAADAGTSAAQCRALDPRRRGQRDQRAAGAGPVGEARPSTHDRPERCRGGRILARRARGGHALRSRAHGPAHAGHGRS